MKSWLSLSITRGIHSNIFFEKNFFFYRFLRDIKLDDIIFLNLLNIFNSLKNKTSETISNLFKKIKK